MKGLLNRPEPNGHQTGLGQTLNGKCKNVSPFSPPQKTIITKIIHLAQPPQEEDKAEYLEISCVNLNLILV